MTGHDVVLLATGPLGERVLFQPWPSVGGLLAPDCVEVLIAGGVAMPAHLDEHGQALDATGDGPVMIRTGDGHGPACGAVSAARATARRPVHASAPFRAALAAEPRLLYGNLS